MTPNQVTGGSFDSEGGGTSLPILTTIPSNLSEGYLAVNTLHAIGESSSVEFACKNTGNGILALSVSNQASSLFSISPKTANLANNESAAFTIVFTAVSGEVINGGNDCAFSLVSNDRENPIQFHVKGNYEVNTGFVFDFPASASFDTLINIDVPNNIVIQNRGVNAEILSAVIEGQYTDLYKITALTPSLPYVLAANTNYTILVTFDAPSVVGIYQNTRLVLRIKDRAETISINLSSSVMTTATLPVSVSTTGARSAKVTWDTVAAATSYEIYIDGRLTP